MLNENHKRAYRDLLSKVEKVAWIIAVNAMLIFVSVFFISVFYKLFGNPKWD